MSVMIQIRNVPEDLHRRLKARAALAGQTLSDYLLREIDRSASLPTREEILARLEHLPRVAVGESASDALAAVRAERAADPRRVARR